jgi:hypothetical protein
MLKLSSVGLRFSHPLLCFVQSHRSRETSFLWPWNHLLDLNLILRLNYLLNLNLVLRFVVIVVGGCAEIHIAGVACRKRGAILVISSHERFEFDSTTIFG